MAEPEPDIVVSNLGIFQPLDFFETDDAIWDRHWQVNVTINNNGWPEKVVIDRSGANLAGLQNINWRLPLHGWLWLIEILQVKYLNNMIEQDHRFIKKLTGPMKGFKSFQSASATLDGIEVAHMIRKQTL